MGGAVCLCGAKWGVSPGIRGGSAGRYAAVGRILKRAGWARLALTAAWNTYALNTPRLPVFLRRLSRKRESAALEDVIFNVWPTTEKDIVLRGLSEGTYEVEAWFSTGAVVRTVNLVAGDEFVMKPRGS